jgi:hypothetical protein
MQYTFIAMIYFSWKIHGIILRIVTFAKVSVESTSTWNLHVC